MKKLLIFILIIVLAVASLMLVFFKGSCSCESTKPSTQQSDNQSNEVEDDVELLVKYLGESLENNTCISFPDFNLLEFDVWGSEDYNVDVSFNRNAPFKFTVDGVEFLSSSINESLTEFFNLSPTKTGFVLAPTGKDFLKETLTSLFKSGDAIPEVEILTDVSELYIYNLAIRDKGTGQRIVYRFTFHSAELKLSGPVVI